MEQIPEHYSIQFGTNWDHLVQQKESRLKECAKLDMVKGKEKTYNQMGKSKMRLITTRNGKTIPSNTALAKRWLRPKFYDEVTHFDEWDEMLLGDVSLPTSEVVQSHAQAYHRICDEVLIKALEGTAYIGEDGTDPVDVPASQKVAVDYVRSGAPANSGLTLGKIIKAKSILGKNEVDDTDELIFVVSQAQLDDLLADVDETRNADYAAVKALVDGNVDYFMGFKFKRTELLTKDDTTDVRTCIAYARSGVVLGQGKKSSQFDRRADMNNTLQIRTVASVGATRLEEEKVVLVYCDESP